MESKRKNNVISDKIRLKGNKCFHKHDYFEALTMYNEALRYAELDSKQLSFGYSNRSAVFLKVQQYKACLENIELARKYELTQDILIKLSERESECKRLMEENKEPIEETWDPFFKLTYEANPKLQFLCNCLELKKHDDGIFLKTNQDLKAGDMIAITEPFVRFSYDTSSYRCNYCLNDKFMNFIPCSGCTEVMFCNDNCMEKALLEFHQFECGIDDNPVIDSDNIWLINILRMIMKCNSIFNGNQKEMEKFLKSNKKKLLTPFDFDLKDPSSLSSQKNIMLTQFCENQQFNFESFHTFNLFYLRIQPFLERHPKLRDIATRKMFNESAYYVLGDAKRFKSIGGKTLSREHQDGGQFVINYYGDAIDICFNLIRYSCAPNIVLHPYNGKIIWIVHYPIKANDWLTVAFNNTVFFEKTRPERLDADPGGVFARCKCHACIGGWDRVIAAVVTPLYIMRYSNEDAIAKFYEYCDEINNSSKPLAEGCDETIWFTISNFRWNLISIGKASFWDKIPQMLNFAGVSQRTIDFSFRATKA